MSQSLLVSTGNQEMRQWDFVFFECEMFERILRQAGTVKSWREGIQEGVQGY